MRALILGAATCSLAFLPWSGLQQDSDTPHPVTQGEKLVLEPGVVPLDRLIEEAGRFLGKTYLITAGKEGPGTIRLQQRLELGREECEVMLSRVLHMHGYGLLVVDAERQIYEWVSLNTNTPRRMELKSSMAFVDPDEVGQGPKRVVMTMVTLRNIDPRQVSATLRPLLTDSQGFSQLQSVGDTSSILLMGFNDWVAQMVKMLTAVDAAHTGVFAESQKRVMELHNSVVKLAERVKVLEERR